MDQAPQPDRGIEPQFPTKPISSEETVTRAMDPPQPNTPIQAGTLLKERYLIVRELSRGGFGKVFLAHDLQLHNKPVVVKIQLDRPIDDPWFERKFGEELRALALIDHPGVVGALDSARTADGKPFLVMQYVEGQPLRAVITPDGMALDRAANIIRQIGQALGAAHDKKIWHRDLKPENIMLQMLPGGDEHVRLIDFGLATIADLAAKQTSTRVAGSAAYMAPEQFTGQPSAATDVYACGVIAFEMITGRKPFVAEDAVQLSLLQRSGVRIKPSALRPGISNAAEKLILNALSYNPSERPVSAPAFGDALCNALLTSQSTQTMELAASHTKRTRIGWLAGGLLVALLAGGFWFYRDRTVPATPATAAVPQVVPAAPKKPGPDSADTQVELAFWNSIASLSDPRLYRDYLAKYPNGMFASVAKLKLEAQLKSSSTTPTTTPAVRSSAQAPTPKPSVPPVRVALRPDEYGGPLRGVLHWTGSLEPGATLVIQGGKAAGGGLSGDLPRIPSSVEAISSGVAVVEGPSAANQWDRVVVKNTSSSPLAGIQLRWRVAR